MVGRLLLVVIKNVQVFSGNIEYGVFSLVLKLMYVTSGDETFLFAVVYLDMNISFSANQYVRVEHGPYCKWYAIIKVFPV